MNKEKIVSYALISILVVCFGVSLLKDSDSGFLGSTGLSETYQSTTTSSSGFANRQVILISNSVGTFGHVVVSSTTPALPTTASCLMKDATSTTDVASTTLASFPVQTSAGTYIFDSNVFRGLIVECGAGFSGNFTITYRP